MKLLALYLLSILILLSLSSWGFYSHKLINEVAIYSLPKELIPFYKSHQFQIKEFAINPDKRVHVDSNEAVKHYIDLDRHPHTDSLILPWYKVEKVYSAQYLLARGIMPWQVKRTYDLLKEAFIKNDADRIIKLSADLGHYIRVAIIMVNSPIKPAYMPYGNLGYQRHLLINMI
jgi:hypothetical protein